MSKLTRRRLVAATVLAVTLAVFTLPAAAAPLGAWTYGTWELPTLLSWFDSLWSGMFGEREGVDTGSWSFDSIHDEQNAAIEPDGTPLQTTTSTGGSGVGSTFTGGSW